MFSVSVCGAIVLAWWLAFTKMVDTAEWIDSSIPIWKE